MSVANYVATTANTLLRAAFVGLAESFVFSVTLQLVNACVNVSAVMLTTYQPSLQSAYANRDIELERDLSGKSMASFAPFLCGTPCPCRFHWYADPRRLQARHRLEAPVDHTPWRIHLPLEAAVELRYAHRKHEPNPVYVAFCHISRSWHRGVLPASRSPRRKCLRSSLGVDGCPARLQQLEMAT